MVTSVMNCPTLQLDVAVAAGVFVEIGRGLGVSVAGTTGSGVKLGVFTTPDMGVALSKACTVCAAAVLAISSILFLEGRLHALRNKAMMISRLNKRVCFFMNFS